jgi:hypothetical protein
MTSRSTNPMRVVCECGQILSIPMALAGKKGRCPKCKRVIICPVASGAPNKNAPPVRSEPQTSQSTHAEPLEQAARNLLRSLSESNWEARDAAQDILGKMDKTRAIGVLISELNGPNRAGRRQMVKLLGKDDRSVETLISLLNDPDTAVADEAYYWLENCDNDRANAALKSVQRIGDCICDHCSSRIRIKRNAFAVVNSGRVTRIYCGRCYTPSFSDSSISRDRSNELALEYLRQSGRL